jgi:hypothetical protein
MIDSTVVRAHHWAVGLKRGSGDPGCLTVREAALQLSCTPAVTVRTVRYACPDTRQSHDVKGFRPLFGMLANRSEAPLADEGMMPTRP